MVSNWHGPALVVAVELKVQEEGDKTIASCVWAVHGSSLLRLLHEHCTPEQQHEREDRERNMLETTSPVTPLERARELLGRVRGPVNFDDYVRQECPPVHEPEPQDEQGPESDPEE